MKQHHVAGLAFIAICLTAGLILALTTRTSSRGELYASQADDAHARPERSDFLSEDELVERNRDRSLEDISADGIDPSTFASAADASSRMELAPVEVTAAWLVGTWGPAEYNPNNDPSASCETDSIVTFGRDGTYRDGSGSGRYRTDGRRITYYDRVLYDPVEDHEDRSEFNRPLVLAATPLSQNSMREDGIELRRCRTG